MKKEILELLEELERRLSHKYTSVYIVYYTDHSGLICGQFPYEKRLSVKCNSDREITYFEDEKQLEANLINLIGDMKLD